LLHEKSDASSRFKQVARKGVKPSSVNTYLQKTRAAFNILKREGVLSENVFNEIRNVKFQKYKVETLTVDEIKRIFNAFNKSYYTQFRSYVLLHALLDTLGRVDETLHLKKQDVDFDKRSVTFQNTKSKKFRLVELTPKTIGQHSSMDDLASKFQIREICLDYDHNVDDIDEVEDTVEELRIDCNVEIT
jgi:site-specific recombinase XerD